MIEQMTEYIKTIDMTRQKEIGTAANRQYGWKGNPPTAGSFNGYKWLGFCNGAKWADEHPKSPWVSVKEELPGNNQVVLLYNKEWINQGKNPRGICIGFFEDNRWYCAEWYYKNYTSWAFTMYDIPTHWCPIPELPKE